MATRSDPYQAEPDDHQGTEELADEDGGEAEGEGGSTWQQQSGYGERVLDPDKGHGAAQEEAERSEQMNERGGA